MCRAVPCGPHQLAVGSREWLIDGPAQTLLLDDACPVLSQSYIWCWSSDARLCIASLQRRMLATVPLAPVEPVKNLRDAAELVERTSSAMRWWIRRLVPAAKTLVHSAWSALRRRANAARTARGRATRSRVRRSTSALLARRLAEGCAPPIAIRSRNACLRAWSRGRMKSSARCVPHARPRAARPPTKTAGRHCANGQCGDGPVAVVSDRHAPLYRIFNRHRAGSVFELECSPRSEADGHAPLRWLAAFCAPC